MIRSDPPPPPPTSCELRFALDWVQVSAPHLSTVAWRRAFLAHKNVEPRSLVELGWLEGDGRVDVRTALDDEAQRMAGVCGTREELVDYLVRWIELVVQLPGRRTRKRNRHPSPITEAVIAAYATYYAREAANRLWAERNAMASWSASR